MEAQDGKPAGQAHPSTVLGTIISVPDEIVSPLSGVIGAAIACFALAFMMFLTFFDVAGTFSFK